MELVCGMSRDSRSTVRWLLSGRSVLYISMINDPMMAENKVAYEGVVSVRSAS